MSNSFSTIKNSKTPRNIILTGATGAVGSNILFELIRKYMDGTYNGKIILLSRGSAKYDLSAKERIINILSNEYAPHYLNAYDINSMMSFIEVVEAELTCASLSGKLMKYEYLENCYVIHSAATTNLANTEKAFEENYKVNYLGSLNLFNASKSFVKKFTFISTAYSCGVQKGLIPHDYAELTKDDFRNHYESLKARIEIELAQMSDEANIDLQILRPAVVCGRVIDAPLYTLANFHVFYGYAKFFHKIKDFSDMNAIHIKYNRDSSIHIVPVDYVSKVIVAAFDNDEIKYLNIAPANGLNLKTVVDGITVDVGYTNSHHTTKIRSDQSKMEKIYYHKLHPIFQGYLDSDSMVIDTKPLEEILPDIPVPDVEPHFQALVDYAVDLDFRTIESVEFEQSQTIGSLQSSTKRIAS